MRWLQNERRRFRARVSSVCSGTSVRRLQGEVHGAGLSANRHVRRRAVHHFRVRALRTFSPTKVECSHLRHFLFSGVKRGVLLEVVKVAQISSAQCSLFSGWVSTHLPLRAERIWIDQQIVFSPFAFRRWRSLARRVCDRSARGTKFAPELFLRHVTGEMRSPWTLPAVVVSNSSEK